MSHGFQLYLNVLTWKVDVKFNQRLAHPPTLALIKHIATSTTLPEQVDYIGQEGYDAIKSMQLVNRGRLSELYCLKLLLDRLD
jgi:hypothetical protein